MKLRKQLTGSVLAAGLLVGVPLGGIALAQQAAPGAVTLQRMAIPANRMAQPQATAQPLPSDAAGPNHSAEAHEVGDSTDAPTSGETEHQELAYAGSIPVPQEQQGQSEADEAAALQSLAKISAEQAKVAAVQANPGATANTVELNSENGTLVYSVQLNTGLDVIVDAGNGAILATAQADANEAGEQSEAHQGTEHGETEDTPAPQSMP